MLKKFKDLIQNTPEATNSRAKYGEPFKKNFAKHGMPILMRTQDPIILKIAQILKPADEGENIPFETFRTFWKELVYRYVLYNESPVDVLSVIKGFWGNAHDLSPDHKGLKPFSCISDWQQAIGLMKEYITIHSPSYMQIDLSMLRRDYPKEFDIAKSVQWLAANYTCKFEIDDNGLLKITEGVDKVIADIQEKIKRIGGITLIEHIFTSLAPKFYKTSLKRFLGGRRTSMTAYEIYPEVPVGFLLNTAAKFPFRGKQQKEVTDLIQQVVNTSILLCNAVFQSQHYSVYEYIYSKGDRLIGIVKDISIFDSIFGFSQGDIETEINILLELFSSIPNDEFMKLCGFTSDTLFAVMQEVADLALDNKSVSFTKSYLINKLQLSTNEVDNLFIALCHKPNKINSDYKNPSEYTTLNFWKKPFVEIASDTALLLNKTWCAKSFYEAVAAKLRKNDTFDNNLGTPVERCVKAIFRANGITFTSGAYKKSGIEGECDIVVETSEAIMLFEVKKKVLTSKAKSGSDTDIVIDLCDSLLDSQTQASRTELLLLNDGYVDLCDQSTESTTRLIHNNRRIYRITLSHLDFRGFHDKFMVDSILETLLYYQIQNLSTEEKIMGKFKTICDFQELLIDQYNQYVRHDNAHANYPFFYTSFMNLDHVYLMAGLSKNNDEFYKYFKSAQNIRVGGSLDFYFDFFMANALTLDPALAAVNLVKE